MSDFKFRLATLLRLREATRDERRQSFAAAERAEDLFQQQADQLAAEWDRVLTITRDAVGRGAIDVGRLIETHRYQKTLEARRTRVGKQLADAKAEVEVRREALIEADRDVRMLEKLRDAQKMRHHQESHRLDMKRIDEATQLRAAFGNKQQEDAKLAGADHHA